MTQPPSRGRVVGDGPGDDRSADAVKALIVAALLVTLINFKNALRFLNRFPLATPPMHGSGLSYSIEKPGNPRTD